MNEKYTIEDLTNIFNITSKQIAFYEKEGMLKKGKGKGYSLEDIIDLQDILFYRAIGLSNNEIKGLFKNRKNIDHLNKFKDQQLLINKKIHKLDKINESLNYLISKIENEQVNYNLPIDLMELIEESNIIDNIKSGKRKLKKNKKKRNRAGKISKFIFVLIICGILVKAITYFMFDSRNNAEVSNQILIHKQQNKIEQPKKITVENEKKNLNSEFLVISNKSTPIGEQYEPTDLVVPWVRFQLVGNDMVKYLRKEAAENLEKLFEEAENQGINLIAMSGYRSYDYQVEVYNNEIYNNGIEQASEYVAKPGESEHQLGLSMDVLSDEYSSLDEGFENTQAYTWLINNMSKFGFILRYPKGKESITGYAFEPWHLRYVGESYAKEIMDNNLTLEEFINQ